MEGQRINSFRPDLLTLQFLDLCEASFHVPIVQAPHMVGTGLSVSPEGDSVCCGCRGLLFPETSAVSPLSSVFAFSLLVFYSFVLLLSSFICFRLVAPNIPPPSFFIFVYLCLIPIIPLGSHLHQRHSFLSQSRGLHTKLPICTLPALSGIDGRSGPAEHAPADGNSPDLRPARPLPASSHRVSARLPR